MPFLGIKVEIAKKRGILAAIRRLFTDRDLYTDMVLDAYASAIDQAFKTQGFGRWAPLRPATISARRRRARKTHYVKPPNDAAPNYPANTWTAKLRDTIAGRSVRSFAPLDISKRLDGFKITSRLSYAEYALRRRPIDEGVRDRIIKIMESKIKIGIVKNIEFIARA